MKLIGLSVPTDGKAIYREIAEITKTGANKVPVETMKVQLYELNLPSGEIINTPKEEVAKLANKLRNGLREFGRYNVKVEGNIAEISVSNRAVRKVAKKGADPVKDPSKTPVPTKKAKA